MSVVDEKQPGETDVERRPVTFRLSPVAYLGIGFLALCATPVAFGAPGLQVVYLVPLALAFALHRWRTVASTSGLTVFRMMGTIELPWSEVTSLRIVGESTVRAVRADDSELPLPAVRPRDLPLLSLASGGQVPDPLATAGDDGGGTGASASPAAESTEAPGTAATDTGTTSPTDVAGEAGSNAPGAPGDSDSER
ncbi:PH domain-containing protein [Actinoalloteichus spitiensis]|uniref:PH domain-containing protein n=1 Tax=Actinoalloteichus spitiensis TaxID=252394 RepID=UPI0003668B7F|nr:PH domain-containing protein [Actinoalloteichus spitiensis]